ncbi:MAG: hypothetical protein V4621_01140 [Pseudomonadota bacterium]
MTAKAKLVLHLQKAYLAKGLPPHHFDNFLMVFKCLKEVYPAINFVQVLNATKRADLGNPRRSVFVMRPPEWIKNNVTECAKALGIPTADFICAALKQPTIFLHNPVTLKARIQESAILLGMKKAAFVNIALKHPSLFYYAPQKLLENITHSASNLGISIQNCVEIASRKPTWFTSKPETLENNLNEIISLIEVEKTLFLKAVARQPSLLTHNPATLKAHIENAAKALGLTRETFIGIAMKQPSLFCNSPSTLGAKLSLLDAFVRAVDPSRITQDFIVQYPVSLTYAPDRLRARTRLAAVFNGLGPNALLSLSEAKVTQKLKHFSQATPATLQ